MKADLAKEEGKQREAQLLFDATSSHISHLKSSLADSESRKNAF